MTLSTYVSVGIGLLNMKRTVWEQLSGKATIPHKRQRSAGRGRRAGRVGAGQVMSGQGGAGNSAAWQGMAGHGRASQSSVLNDACLKCLGLSRQSLVLFRLSASPHGLRGECIGRKNKTIDSPHVLSEIIFILTL